MIVATLLTPTVYNWQVEDAWINVTAFSDTINGVAVSPAVNPVVSRAGNTITVTDSAKGITFSPPRFNNTNPDESRLVDYEVYFKIRWTGVGSPPTTGLAGTFTWDDYAFIAASATLDSSSSSDFIGTVATGFSPPVGILTTLSTPGSSFATAGSTTLTYAGGSAAQTTRFTDSYGPYWILVTGGGFGHDLELDFNGTSFNSALGSTAAVKYTLTTHNLDPVDPN